MSRLLLPVMLALFLLCRGRPHESSAAATGQSTRRCPLACLFATAHGSTAEVFVVRWVHAAPRRYDPPPARQARGECGARIDLRARNCCLHTSTQPYRRYQTPRPTRRSTAHTTGERLFTYCCNSVPAAIPSTDSPTRNRRMLHVRWITKSWQFSHAKMPLTRII
jgi:hypothetical protein